MTKFSRFLIALAGVAALALLVLGGTSVLAPAWADYEAGHDEVARGRIGVLEQRVLNCENKIAPCERIGLQGPQGEDGFPGADGPLAVLTCDQGQTVIYDTTGGWVCH